jgi:hypothetical protein
MGLYSPPTQDAVVCSMMGCRSDHFNRAKVDFLARPNEMGQAGHLQRSFHPRVAAGGYVAPPISRESDATLKSKYCSRQSRKTSCNTGTLIGSVGVKAAASRDFAILVLKRRATNTIFIGPPIRPQLVHAHIWPDARL